MIFFNLYESVIYVKGTLTFILIFVYMYYIEYRSYYLGIKEEFLDSKS